MLKLLFMIFAGLIIGALLLLFIIPFLVFLSFLKFFSKKSSNNVFIWRSGSRRQNSYDAGNFDREEKNSSENLSDSVYDIKAEVVETVKKSEDRKQIQD